MDLTFGYAFISFSHFLLFITCPVRDKILVAKVYPPKTEPRRGEIYSAIWCAMSRHS